MKPTFIINKSSYKVSTLYNIMESNGDAFARLQLLTDSIHFEDYNVWITDFEVVEEKRRQGYATAMLQLIQTLAPADETIALEVALDAPHWVVAFYEKHGIVISNKEALILDGEEKEEAERRIAELDQKVEELSQLMDKTTDETEKARLLDELMQTYRETNRWLCAIGADESQMYDI